MHLTAQSWDTLNCLCRERKWKLGQAKRYGRLCARSNLDLESRAAAKAKQEAAAIRRRSAWIAKEACSCPHLAVLSRFDEPDAF
jgi:hypothetical protein